MTMYATVPSLVDRALALPHMIEMLHTLHRKHLALHGTVIADALYRAMPSAHDRLEDHMLAARHAGLIDAEQDGSTLRMKLSITQAGRDVIGVKAPLWVEAAA